LPSIASALDYPTRPVRIIVGFPPGGANDILALLMSQWLSERTGQQIFPTPPRAQGPGQPLPDVRPPFCR
jgi:tripartite-type tricarboxylate transporter receptor subunit TctC